MKNISVIGLGSMGYGIAQSLIRSGYMVYGQDKNLLRSFPVAPIMVHKSVDPCSGVDLWYKGNTNI